MSAPRDAQDGVPETSLRRRLSLALVASGVLLALVVMAAVWALVEVERRQEQIHEVYFAAITEVDSLRVAIIDVDSGVRTYAQTADPLALEPLNRILAEPEPERDIADILTEHLGPESAALAARERAGETAAAWYEEFVQPTIAQVEAEGANSVAPADLEQGTALFQAFAQDVEEYTDVLSQGRLEALRALDGSMGVLRTILAALALAPVVVGVLLWVFLRRWVTDPLAVLASDARIVAEGDVDHRVTDAGPGEVGDLARDIEHMRGRLARLLQEAAGSRAELQLSHTRLREQAEDLARSNRDLEQFAYVASHDLQEPLRKVASFTQLLAKRYEGQLDDRADQYIGFAVDGAKRMQRLINDLLGFSRVGRIGGELAEVDLVDALAQATTDLQDVIDETGAVIDGEGLPTVTGEAPLLVQLLVNLVGNALKFRHPDRQPVVTLEGRRAGDFWELSCRDNGIGIDPQYADRVFVIFQRLHAKDVYEGTGIGLALCKKIVEYHGGEIWIDAAEEAGTVVRWTLPVHQPSLAPQDVPAARPHAVVEEEPSPAGQGKES